MKKAVLWTLPFLLGLSIAWCGSQLTEGRSASSGQSPISVGPGELPGTLSLDPLEVESGREITPQADDADPSDGSTNDLFVPTRSPLAETVRELGSARPEQALVGVGEPIGFVPLSLSIAELDVSAAPVEPVGIEENGELEVPGAHAIGWYQFGSGIGGGRGSTVLAGHIAFDGVDGVFRNLDRMQPGQIVAVEHDGAELFYEVVDIVQYTKSALPIEDLFREDGEERIVLITCGGSFNPSIRSYDDNVVVIAVPV